MPSVIITVPSVSNAYSFTFSRTFAFCMNCNFLSWGGARGAASGLRKGHCPLTLFRAIELVTLSNYARVFIGGDDLIRRCGDTFPQREGKEKRPQTFPHWGRWLSEAKSDEVVTPSRFPSHTCSPTGRGRHSPAPPSVQAPVSVYSSLITRPSGRICPTKPKRSNGSTNVTGA